MLAFGGLWFGVSGLEIRGLGIMGSGFRAEGRISKLDAAGTIYCVSGTCEVLLSLRTYNDFLLLKLLLASGSLNFS